ncbi:trimeric autotransporter adhesin, partial [Klebsiella oxytoca]
MNTVYRLVWNASLGIWVAVSELAKARGKGKSGLRRARRALPVALLSVTLVGVPGTADAWMVTTATTGANSSAADRGIASNTVVGNGAKAAGLITADGNATGTGAATAVGNAAEASGYRAVSIGAGSKATQEKSTALGFGAEATQAFTFAAGTQASASGYASTAVGSSSIASGIAATALGQQTTASGAYSTAVGQKSTTGTLTTASGFGALAVGGGSVASGENSIVLGSDATASGLAGIAIGLNSKVMSGTGTAGTYSAAIGNGASTYGSSSLAFGYNAKANTDVFNQNTGLTREDIESTNSTAIGAQAKSATRSVAVGTLASAATNYSIAIGNNAQTLYEESIAIGMNSQAGHIADPSDPNDGGSEGKSVALGHTALATGAKATAVGAEASATGKGSVAVGSGVEATSYQAIAMGGVASKVDETTGQAIDIYTSARGAGSVALGAGAVTTQSNSVALGIRTESTGISTVAIGQQAVSTGKTSLAIGGVAAKSTGHESVALGSYTEATAEGATALGQSVVLTADGQRVTSTTGTGGIRTATAASGEYSVAVGSGATSQALDSIAMGTLAVASKDAIGGIAIGLESKVDAVNATAIGAEAEALGESAFAAGAGAKAEGTSSTAVGTSSYALGASSTALGDLASATAGNSLALGNSATASHGNSVALGANSETAEHQSTTSIQVNNKTQNVKGSAVGTVSVGTADNERTITNVAAGRVSNDSTDAINGSQLQAVIDTPMKFAGNSGATIEKKLGENEPLSITGEGAAEGTYTGHNLKTVVEDGGLKIQMTDTPEFTSVTTGNTLMNSSGLTITGGPSVLATGIDAGGKKITGVAAGTNTTDAVNFGQLTAQAETPLTFAANTGTDAKRKLGETMKILGGGTVGEAHSAGNILTEMDADGNLIIKMADNAKLESLTTGNTLMNSSGLTIAGGPSVLATGIDAGGKKITGVAAGTNTTDAVNFGQLTAQAETPLTFAANTGTDAKRKLGETMKILGGGTVGEAHSAGNILTEMDADG